MGSMLQSDSTAHSWSTATTEFVVDYPSNGCDTIRYHGSVGVTSTHSGDVDQGGYLTFSFDGTVDNAVWEHVQPSGTCF